MYQALKYENDNVVDVMPNSETCVPLNDYLILRSTTEVVIQRYVFPVQFFFGFIGNVVNLIVLLSRGMRSEVDRTLIGILMVPTGSNPLTSLLRAVILHGYANPVLTLEQHKVPSKIRFLRSITDYTKTIWVASLQSQVSTNVLLSVMAFADLGLLCSMLPGSLAAFSFAYRSSIFRWYFYKTKVYFHTFANFFPAISTWLILVVSIERFAGIRSPMGARHRWNFSSAIIVIVIIFVFSFLVTSWRFFAYDVLIYKACNGTQIVGHTQMANESAPEKPTYVSIYLKYGQLIQPLSTVIIPIVAVAVLNVPLICFMRKRKVINNTRKNRTTSTTRRPRSNSDFCIMQRQERKVTATVLAIVTCFTLTNAPALIPVIMLTCEVKISDTNYSMAAHIANSIVVTGKVLNFLLFCTSSAHFRRKLLAICETVLYKVMIKLMSGDDSMACSKCRKTWVETRNKSVSERDA